MYKLLCFSGEQTSPQPVRPLNYFTFLCCPQCMTNLCWFHLTNKSFHFEFSATLCCGAFFKFANLLHVPVDCSLPADGQHRLPLPAKSTALALRSCLLAISWACLRPVEFFWSNNFNLLVIGFVCVYVFVFFFVFVFLSFRSSLFPRQRNRATFAISWSCSGPVLQLVETADKAHRTCIRLKPFSS